MSPIICENFKMRGLGDP